MHELSTADRLPIEADTPTDLLAALLMERARQPRAAAPAQPERLSLKVYGVMAVTSLLTFATLATGYQTLFTHSVFA